MLQKDEHFKARVAREVKTFFADSFEGDIEGSLIDLNLFFPRLVMEHIVVTPTHTSHGWSWSAKKGTVYFSWFTFLLTGRLAIHIELGEYEADSEVVNSDLMLVYHLKKLFEPPKIQIAAFLKSLTITKGVLRAVDKAHKIHAHIAGQIDMKRVNQITKINFKLTDGACAHNKTTYMHEAAGTFAIEVSDKDKQTFVKVVANGNCALPHLDKPKCSVQGSWLYDHGQFKLHNDDSSCAIDPITIDSSSNLSTTVHLPLAILTNMFPALGKSGDFKGACTATINADLTKGIESMRATVMVDDIQYKNMHCDSVRLAFNPEGNGLKGTIDITVTPTCMLNGTGEFKQGQLVLTVHNSDLLSLPASYWQIEPQDISISTRILPDLTFDADFKSKMHHRLLDTYTQAHARLHKKEGTIVASGVIDSKTAHIELELEPAFVIKKCEIKDKDTVFVQCSGNQKKVQGTINYSFIHSLLPDAYKDLQGDGKLNISLQPQSEGLVGSLSLSEGVIKLPKVYNFINAFNANFNYNFADKRAIISSLVCNLHRGVVTSSRVTAQFDQHYNLSFMHVPLTFDSCFLSWQKDLFAIVSGSLVYRKQLDGPASINGFILADKAQLKGNLLSHELQKSLFIPGRQSNNYFDVDMNIHCMTQEPLTVQTSFLDAKAKIDITIKKSFENPQVSGGIDVISGELKFPYKPLTIVHGKIMMTQEQFDDPLIELTAKNKIKKYSIGMHVSGSLKSPRIHCESSPDLTESQVVSLLLAGAEDSSFNLLMPTLVMQNMQHIILGPAQSDSKLATYFNSLLKPLAFVRIVPRFNDESGRGGLRGAIEINVNDRLTGLIEKNFSLPEDTKFEVDYALSDDVSIRGIKDEHGDLGGEFEMRWKF
jgi:hypothetical protein